jgi:hypothetical protein
LSPYLQVKFSPSSLNNMLAVLFTILFILLLVSSAATIYNFHLPVNGGSILFIPRKMKSTTNLNFFINWYEPQGKHGAQTSATSCRELTQPLVRRSFSEGGFIPAVFLAGIEV